MEEFLFNSFSTLRERDVNIVEIGKTKGCPVEEDPRAIGAGGSRTQGTRRADEDIRAIAGDAGYTIRALCGEIDLARQRIDPQAIHILGTQVREADI